jgi:hypothetical protein
MNTTRHSPVIGALAKMPINKLSWRRWCSFVLALLALSFGVGLIPVSHAQAYDPALKNYWTFNSDANDQVGTTHGTYYGMYLSTGVFGNGLYPYYSNSYCYAPNPFLGLSSWTAALWFKRPSSSGYGPLFVVPTNMSEGFTAIVGAYFTGDYLVLRLHGETYSLYLPGTTGFAWQHLALRHQAVESELAVYLNGA